MAVLTITIPLPDDKNYTVSVYPSDSIQTPLTKHAFMGMMEQEATTSTIAAIWEELENNDYEIVKKKIT